MSPESIILFFKFKLCVSKFVYCSDLVAVLSKSPYSMLVTHGFVLDEKGRKMSKSVGNVVSPVTVTHGGKVLCLKPIFYTYLRLMYIVFNIS